MRDMFSYLYIFLLVLGLAMPTVVVASENTQGVRVFLKNGNPEQAVRTAQMLLANSQLEEGDRHELLKLVAEAEFYRAKVRHFDQVETAVGAVLDVLSEFPESEDEAELQFMIVQLYQGNGDLDNMTTAIRKLKQSHPLSPEATQASLIMARHDVLRGAYDEARSNLLDYGVKVEEGTRKQALGEMWTAVVDYYEGRFKEAYQAIKKVYQQYPDAVESDEKVFAVYVLSASIEKHDSIALEMADEYLKRYVEGADVADIRLLQADLLLKLQKAAVPEVIKLYDLIAQSEVDNSVGKKAFMRKLMLLHQDEASYTTLKPVLIALKHLADTNQLSDVEAEAMLDQARLWVRLIDVDPEKIPSQAHLAALQQFAQVSSSKYPALAQAALLEGRSLLVQSIEKSQKQEDWLQVVSVWERFPQLRPEGRGSEQLKLGVAHALRMLMQYEQSEGILNALYKDAGGSVWGQKVMLERARLWLDRGDTEGRSRVQKWLGEHEYTLYRPEMMLIVAQMQLQQKEIAAASQTFSSIAAEDVALDRRAEYWQAKAKLSEALSRWHVAAHAWEQYAKFAPEQKNIAAMHQADNLFKAKDYLAAEVVYEQVDEAGRTAEWKYRFSICQLRTGKLSQASERLEALKNNAEAGVYASLARLALAEQKADDLLRKQP